MAPPYEYTPLPPGADQIRLLTLLPASELDEEIAVSLQPISIEAAERQYEALSYVWGSSDDPRTISIVTSSRAGSENGDVSPSECSAAAPLLVTQNLAIALHHLRWRDTPRTLWIDAICIDQQNEAEKSEQVGRMAQIYSSAARVVIWLGPASPDSDLAMRHVDHLGQTFHYDPGKNTVMLTSDGAADPYWVDNAEALPYEEAGLRALEKLLWRPWFDRLWVLQEVLLSTEAIVVCGNRETAWQSVRVALWCLSLKDTKVNLVEQFLSRLRHMRSIFDTKPNEKLLLLLDRTRGLKCTDDRDRIYALLSLIEDTGSIKPDYSLSTVQVYRKVAALWMARKGLRFLGECELGNRRLAGPTWIPDWTVEKATNRIYPFNAAMFAEQMVLGHPAEGSIQVAAVRVGTVVDVDVVTPLRDISLYEHSCEIARLAPANVETSTYKTGCSLMEAFAGTLLCSDLLPWVPQDSNFMTLQQNIDAVRDCLRSSNSNGDGFVYPSDATKYIALSYRYMKNRALVRTDQGYLGLAPSGVKKGDHILAILSCTSFTVVRPAPGVNSRYHVVGESFLYGLTNGEAVLGPLPEHVTVEHLYHPQVGLHFEAYRDTRTGGVSWIDPRLEALGIPIRTKVDGIPCAVSENELKEAGVRLEEFHLV